MSVIYCADHHEPGSSDLCDGCEKLMRYSYRRLQKCPYGQDKPTCANCPIHCYKKLQRQQVRIIMRYAGPRMMLRHPVRALTHSLDKLRQVRHPMEIRRSHRRNQGGPSA